MCDPVTIAGIALTGLSTGLNSAAASKAANAREDALAAERIRQSTLDRESDALNVKSQDRYQNFEGQQNEKATQLKDYFTTQQVAAPSAEAALPTTSSNITVQEEAKQRGQAKADTDRAGNALGELRSFGDLLGGISRLQARDASQIGQIGGFKRGSQGVLPLELDAASQKGGNLAMLGQIAGGLGNIGVTAGLSGQSFPSLFGGTAPTVGGGAVYGPPGVPTPKARPSGIASLYGGNAYSLYG